MNVSPDAAETVMFALVPVMEDANRSVAVMVCVPSETSEAEKVPTPAVSAPSRESVENPSVLVKCTGSP